MYRRLTTLSFLDVFNGTLVEFNLLPRRSWALAHGGGPVFAPWLVGPRRRIRRAHSVDRRSRRCRASVLNAWRMLSSLLLVVGTCGPLGPCPADAWARDSWSTGHCGWLVMPLSQCDRLWWFRFVWPRRVASLRCLGEPPTLPYLHILTSVFRAPRAEPFARLFACCLALLTLFRVWKGLFFRSPR